MRATTPRSAGASLRVHRHAALRAGALSLPRVAVARLLRAPRRVWAAHAAHEAPTPLSASPPPAVARALPALAAALRAAAPVVRRRRLAPLLAGPPEVSTGGEIEPKAADLSGPGVFGIPQRWLLVAATSAAFVLCNMDKVRHPCARRGAQAAVWGGFAPAGAQPAVFCAVCAHRRPPRRQVNMSVALIPMAAEFGWSGAEKGLVRRVWRACCGGRCRASYRSLDHAASAPAPRTRCWAANRSSGAPVRRTSQPGVPPGCSSALGGLRKRCAVPAAPLPPLQAPSDAPACRAARRFSGDTR